MSFESPFDKCMGIIVAFACARSMAQLQHARKVLCQRSIVNLM
jgi:hypothetical protein